jgi:hypothetical protein
MRNFSWRSLLATSLFAAGLQAQTLDSVLSGEKTLSTFYSLVQVCYQLRIYVRIIADFIATEISRYHKRVTFWRYGNYLTRTAFGQGMGTDHVSH